MVPKLFFFFFLLCSLAVAGGTRKISLWHNVPSLDHVCGLFGADSCYLVSFMVYLAIAVIHSYSSAVLTWVAKLLATILPFPSTGYLN